MRCKLTAYRSMRRGVLTFARLLDASSSARPMIIDRLRWSVGCHVKSSVVGGVARITPCEFCCSHCYI